MSLQSNLELAEDPNTPPEVFIKLADSPSSGLVFYNLSLNPNTPMEALCKISEYYFSKVDFTPCFVEVIFINIINHPNTPTHVKQYLQAKLYLSHYVRSRILITTDPSR